MHVHVHLHPWVHVCVRMEECSLCETNTFSDFGATECITCDAACEKTLDDEDAVVYSEDQSSRKGWSCSPGYYREKKTFEGQTIDPYVSKNPDGIYFPGQCFCQAGFYYDDANSGRFEKVKEGDGQIFDKGVDLQVVRRVGSGETATWVEDKSLEYYGFVTHDLTLYHRDKPNPSCASTLSPQHPNFLHGH